jgi:hypothetical protein
VEELTVNAPPVTGDEPVPLIATVCGEAVALSDTLIDALSVAAVVGVKLTVMVQEAPAASEVPQVLVWPKLVALVPVTETPERARTAVPGLESVTGKVAADVPTVVLAKASEPGVNVASGARAAEPTPVSATVCGEPVALSATVIDAERFPVTLGVKPTVIVQEAAAASEVPQVLVWLKLVAFVPVTEMLEMARAAVPGLVRVIGRAVADVPTGVLGKGSGFGASVACGARAAAPVPLIAADCGEPTALSTTVREAERLPAAAGVKPTVIVQEPPAATDAPQLLVWLKLPEFVPAMEMLEIVRAAVPRLESVMGRVVAEVPTVVLGKASGLGERVA